MAYVTRSNPGEREAVAAMLERANAAGRSMDAETMQAKLRAGFAAPPRRAGTAPVRVPGPDQRRAFPNP